MATKKTWGEALQEELQGHLEYQTELLVLRVNGAIRRRMRELGLTQEDLARRLGVSQPYVSKLLNYNRNLTLSSLARIAHALHAEWAEPELVQRAARTQPRRPSAGRNGARTDRPKSAATGAAAKRA